jgi:hypothetical protein
MSFHRLTRTPSPSGGGFASYQYTADDVSLSSAHLEDYFNRDRLRVLLDPEPTTAPSDVLRRLVEWTKGDAANILWLDGPSINANDQDNPATVLAATVLNFVTQSKLPVLSYFCQSRRGETLRGDNTAEAQALMALVTALIRQMVELLLPAFNSEADLSSKRIARVDGNISSFDETLGLWCDLVHLMPPANRVFCIIDGLHWIDDRSTGKHLQRFMGVLRDSNFRIFLTTSGRAASLRQALSKDETIYVNNFSRGNELISQNSLSS